MKRLILTFIVILVFSGLTFSQQQNISSSSNQQKLINNNSLDASVIFERMQNPNTNYYETVKMANAYFNSTPRTKGDGFKPYKRWEWRMQSRVKPDGTLPLQRHNLKELKKFKSNYESYSPKTTTGTWQEVGPTKLPANATGQPNGMGRINCMAFHPTNANIFYAGAPSGGLWKTSDGGTSWDVLTDDLPTLGISAIIVDYNNPDIIYIGTGDRDAYDAPGLGIWKSIDGGVNWVEKNGLGMKHLTVSSIIQHPTNSNILYATGNYGYIYKTIDAGKTWTTNYDVNSGLSLAFKPNDPSVIYITNKNGKFYKSVDSGKNYTQVTFPDTFSGRAFLATSKANPNFVAVVVAHPGVGAYGGLFLSTNSGANFNMTSNTKNLFFSNREGKGSGGQGFYDIAITVDPTNINNIYVGGVNIWKSINSGDYFSNIAHWSDVGKPHADHHYLGYNPLNGRLYNGNDGGIYFSDNGGNSWTNISGGLRIAQLYKIGQSSKTANKVISGYQDNGTSVSEGDNFTTTIGGDGMECAFDPTDDSYIYGSLYYGKIRRSVNGGYFYTIAENGKGGITEQGPWVTPFLISNNDANTMYAGYVNVWRSTNLKVNSPPSFTNISRGLVGSGHCIVMEQSEKNPEILYLGKNHRLYRTDNATTTNPTWTSALATSYTATDIEVHPTNENIVYMTTDGYTGNKVLKSTDKGVNWTDITGNLPAISKNCLVFDIVSKNEAIYVGTDAGVYYINNSMTDWILFSANFPIGVIVNELEIAYNSTNHLNSEIKAATYGRGLWKSKLYRSATKPLANFSSEITKLCSSTSAAFTDKSTNFPTSWLWSFSPNTVTYINGTTNTSQNPQVEFTTTGSYSVSLKATNAFGNNTKLKSDLIVISKMTTLPFVEDFDDALVGWEVDPAWKINSPYNGNTASGKINCISLEGYNDGYNGKKYALISPSIDFTGKDNVTLNFEHAYAKSYLDNLDRLTIYISPDCGVSWVELADYGKDAKQLITVNGVKNDFKPAPTDWCGDVNSDNYACNSINLSAYDNTRGLKIKFVVTNVGYGNNFYLDNITITSDKVILKPNTDFTVNNSIICDGYSLNFTDKSTHNPTSWSWAFSPNTITYENGSISSSQNPTVIFNTPGNYNVTLIATNVNGANTKVKSNFIKVNPKYKIALNKSICSGSSYNFDGNNYTTSGKYTANLTSAAGCDSVVTLDLTINSLPEVSCPENISTTSRDIITLLGATPQGGKYTGVGVSSNQFDPKGLENGNYTITYTYQNSESCSAFCEFDIILNTVGIKDIESNINCTIFPNPTSDACTLTLTLEKPQEIIVRLVNNLGQEIELRKLDAAKEFNETFDFSGMTPGIYSLLINIDGKQITKRVVLN